MEPTTGTYKQEKSEKQIVDRVMSLKASYEQSTKDLRSEYADIYANYMGKLDEVQEVPYDAKETIPKLRTEVAYVKPFIFSGQPEIEIEGVGDEDKTIAQIFEKIVNFRLKQSIPNAYEKIEAWVHQAVTFGTSVLKVIWRFETRKVTEAKPVPQEYRQEGDPETQEIEYEEVILDEPDFDVPNILDVYFNPLIQDVKDQPCLIFRSVLPIEEIKNNPAYDYVNKDGVRNADTIEAGKAGIQNDPYNSSVLMGTDIPNAQQKATEGMIEVFELVDNDRIQTVANGKLLRDVPNKYGDKGAVKLIFEPTAIPNRFTGMGVGQNTLGLGKLYFKMFNQAKTNVTMGNNPMFLARRGKRINPKDGVSKPGGVIFVDGEGPLSNDIQPIIFKDLSTGFVDLISKVDDEHKRASGANDLIQGSSSNNTLGQDEIAQANVSNRFELIQRRFKEALSEVARVLLKRELENLQDENSPILRIFPEVTEVESGQFDEMGNPIMVEVNLRRQIYELLVSEEAKNAKFNVRIKGETNVAQNKNITVKQLLDWYNLFVDTLTPTEKRAVGRRILTLRNQDNIDELMAAEAPMMPMPEEGAVDGSEVPQLNAGMTQNAQSLAANQV